MAIDVSIDNKVVEQPKVETPVVDNTEEQVVEERELSPTEQQASLRGWTPKEEWEAAGNDPNDWRSAKEFLDRGELLDRIKDQSREIKQITAIVGQLSEHNRQVYAAGYKKALGDLRAARAQAIEDRDSGKLVQIEEAIDNTKEALKKIEQTPAQAPQQVQETEAFKAFKERNPWYATQSMKHWAHGMAIDYANQNPQASEEEVYRYIEKEVRKEFPQKFTTTRQVPPSPDGDSRRNAGPASRSSSPDAAFNRILASMPEDQARVARDMVRRNIVSKEKYVQDYEAIASVR